MRRSTGAVRVAVLGLLCLLGAASSAGAATGIQKIKHVVIIMQENRSFDSYFGTYPGADGIPRDRHGHFTVCVPDPASATPASGRITTTATSNAGGPHMAVDARSPTSTHGKMNGFIAASSRDTLDTDQLGCQVQKLPSTCVDVMGYHNARELPHYWAYAHNFVLQDHMFEPNAVVEPVRPPVHGLGLVGLLLDPATIRSAAAPTSNLPRHRGRPGRRDRQQPGRGADRPAHRQRQDDAATPTQPPDYAWTDITYLLHKHQVSWRYYLSQGTEPDCANGAMTCTPVPQNVETPEIWNPLPDFADVHQDHQLGNIQADTQVLPRCLPRERCRRSRG